MTTMTITIDRLEVYAHHGVFEQERKVGNRFEVTVSLDCLVSEEATEGDELGGTVNYAEVIDEVRQVMAEPSRLLEHVVSRIKERITSHRRGIVGGAITLTKLTPPVSAVVKGVSVSVKW